MTNLEQLNVIIKETYDKRKELYIQEDKNLITKQMYSARLRILEKKLNLANQEKLKILYEQQKEMLQNKKENIISITKDKNPTLKKKKKVKGERRSIKGMIISLLKHPDVDNEDKLIYLIKDKSPKTHEENIRIQTRMLISAIKNNKIKEYSDYEWDAENYKMVPTKQRRLF